MCVCVCDAFTVQTLIEPLGQVAAPAAGCGGENKKEEGGRGGEETEGMTGRTKEG